jgi:5-methylcytosine-specific restriction endonuclease McrA
MNRWNIPTWLEKEVIERDKHCVYCREFFGSRVGKSNLASWEHIINDAKIVTRENIVLCCRSCNSSKGAKTLTAWLESAYCKRRGISDKSVADIVKKALEQAKNP